VVAFTNVTRSALARVEREPGYVSVRWFNGIGLLISGEGLNVDTAKIEPINKNKIASTQKTRLIINMIKQLSILNFD
jgi:hypothetical protein